MSRYARTYRFLGWVLSKYSKENRWQLKVDTLLRTKVSQLNFSSKTNYFLLKTKLYNFLINNLIENIRSIFWWVKKHKQKLGKQKSHGRTKHVIQNLPYSVTGCEGVWWQLGWSYWVKVVQDWSWALARGEIMVYWTNILIAILSVLLPSWERQSGHKVCHFKDHKVCSAFSSKSQQGVFWSLSPHFPLNGMLVCNRIITSIYLTSVIHQFYHVISLVSITYIFDMIDHLDNLISVLLLCPSRNTLDCHSITEPFNI